jgi:hypothetical protein
LQEDGLEFEVTDKGTLMVKHGKSELNGKVLKLTVSKRSSGPFSISVNGRKIFPEGFNFPSASFFLIIHDMLELE